MKSELLGKLRVCGTCRSWNLTFIFIFCFLMDFPRIPKGPLSAWRSSKSCMIRTMSAFWEGEDRQTITPEHREPKYARSLSTFLPVNAARHKLTKHECLKHLRNFSNQDTSNYCHRTDKLVLMRTQVNYLKSAGGLVHRLSSQQDSPD